MKKSKISVILSTAMIILMSFATAQEGISGGAPIIYVNVVIDTALNLSTLTADSVVADYVSTSELLADSAKVDTVISTGGASFGGNIKTDSTVTAASVSTTSLAVSGSSTFNDDAVFDSTITALEIFADTIHSGSQEGIAKFTAGVLGTTDTLGIPRTTGLQDTIDAHTDSLEAHRTELSNFISGVTTIGAGDSIRVGIPGLTTSGVIVTSYKKSAPLVVDTASTSFIWKSDTLTVYGKYNESIFYFGKK